MGLDIWAYNKLHQLDPDTVEKAEDGYPLAGDVIWFGDFSTQNEYWPGRAEPLDQAEEDAYYTYDTKDYMRAGSYSGYHQWRGLLYDYATHCCDAHDDPYAFKELIDFSDCDGVIGSVVSQKLYEDFVAYRGEADQFAEQWFEDDEDTRKWFLDEYDDWCRIFDLARDEGCVVFA